MPNMSKHVLNMSKTGPNKSKHVQTCPKHVQTCPNVSLDQNSTSPWCAWAPCFRESFESTQTTPGAADDDDDERERERERERYSGDGLASRKVGKRDTERNLLFGAEPTAETAETTAETAEIAETTAEAAETTAETAVLPTFSLPSVGPAAGDSPAAAQKPLPITAGSHFLKFNFSQVGESEFLMVNLPSVEYAF